jgi:Ser/Thr protein kinase RdoA (MazF antagonist)
VSTPDPDKVNSLPFAGLDPERIVAAVEALGIVCDGRILALNSYENRVYRIGREGEAPLVAKFYRPGRWSDAAILEEHAFSAELQAADIFVVAPIEFAGRTLHYDRNLRFALFPMRGGHAPEPGDKEALRQIGRTLGRFHAVGAAKPFKHRGALSIETHAIDPTHYLLETGWLPPSLEAKFENLCDALIDQIEQAWADAGELQVFRLHGDFHAGNILWRDGAAHLLDLDDALIGPAIQDLWMLLSGEPAERQQQLGWLLEGYEVFRSLPRGELRLIEALRSMRMLHFHAWIARRWNDPAFPAAFPGFETPRHWEDLIGQLQEQCTALREPALSPA